MPRYLGNFPKTQTFGEFPKYPVIWEISKILKIYHAQIWENPQNTWNSGEFPKYLGIRGIPQVPGYLGNSPNTLESGDFPK